MRLVMCAGHGQRPLLNSMTLVLRSSTPQPSAFPTPCPPPPAAVHPSLHNKQHQESLSFTWERTWVQNAESRTGVWRGGSWERRARTWVVRREKPPEGTSSPP